MRNVARVALVLGSLVLFLVVFEVLLRTTNALSLDWRMVEHHPTRVEMLAPNFDGMFKGIRVRTNEFGHRVPATREKSYREAKPPGATRILVFGDSMAFGDEWPAESSFPEQLQDQLDPTFTRVQVLNLGVPGYGPSQEWDYVREAALRFQSDIVILEFTEANDLERDPEANRAPVRGLSVKTWLRRHLYTYSATFDIWYNGKESAIGKALHLARPSKKPNPLLTPHGGDIVTEARRDQADPWFARHLRDVGPDGAPWQDVNKAYTSIRDYLRANRISLIVVSLPISWDLICRKWDCRTQTIRFSELDEGGQEFYAALKERFRAITPDALFAADWFGPYSLSVLGGDRATEATSHYGPTKNRIVATGLAERIRRIRH